VYAYIEAKHTLNIEGEVGSSLRRAIDQVSKVKLLCNTKDKVELSNIRPYLNFGGSDALFAVTMPPGFPDRLNPCFTAIIARQVRQKASGAILADASQITPLLEGVQFPAESCPDVIILGAHNVVLPVVWKGATELREFASPFFIPELKRPLSYQTDGIAFGVGLCLLLFALDWINLGQMKWQTIILDAVLKKEPT
jgi:hypothetical protein